MFNFEFILAVMLMMLFGMSLYIARDRTPYRTEIYFDNGSSDSMLIKLIGPTGVQEVVEVPSGEIRAIKAAVESGEYHLIVRTVLRRKKPEWYCILSCPMVRVFPKKKSKKGA